MRGLLVNKVLIGNRGYLAGGMNMVYGGYEHACQQESANESVIAKRPWTDEVLHL